MKENPRPGFLYWSDDGDLMALRYGNWKIHFMEQRAEGFDAWQDPFAPLRFPKLVNLRTDPFENADISGDCSTRSGGRIASSCWRRPAPSSAQYMQTHDGVPARQRPESWSVGDVMEKLQRQQGGAGIRLGRRSEVSLERHD